MLKYNMIKYTKGIHTKRFLSFINSLWNFSELYWNQYEGENVFYINKAYKYHLKLPQK